MNNPQRPMQPRTESLEAGLPLVPPPEDALQGGGGGREGGGEWKVGGAEGTSDGEGGGGTGGRSEGPVMELRGLRSEGTDLLEDGGAEAAALEGAGHEDPEGPPAHHRVVPAEAERGGHTGVHVHGDGFRGPVML